MANGSGIVARETGAPEYAPNPPLTLLQKFDSICNELFDRWDRDMRSGKLLLALLGRLPSYKAEVTEVRNAIAVHDDLVKAATKVLAGLNARIEAAAKADAPHPVFDGIADLHAALSRIKTEG